MIKKVAIGFGGGLVICWATMWIGFHTAYSSNLYWLVFGVDHNIFYLFHEHGTPRPSIPLLGTSMIIAVSTISLLFALALLLITSPPLWKRRIGYVLVSVLLLATLFWFKKPVWAPTPF